MSRQFSNVERRLTLINIAAVIGIVSLIGFGLWAALRQSLEDEANDVLDERIEITDRGIGPNGPNANEGSGSGRGNGPNNTSEPLTDEEALEVLMSGDIIAFTVDADGNQVMGRRSVSVPGFPVEDAITAALQGETTTRHITVNGSRIRVRTEPVMRNGTIVGAIQVARSDARHHSQLDLIRNLTLGGTALGVMAAIPAGLFLTRRAMTPIHETFARQRAFVSDASHELRTPITILRANAELLQRQKSITKPELDEEMGGMVEELDSMTHLVNGLLDLSRADDGRLDVTPESVDLAIIAQKVASTMADRARAQGVGITLEVLPTLLSTSPQYVEQIIRILLDNAIKYTPSGGMVTLRAEPHARGGRLIVRDTGIGIPEEDVPHVFDRFYRADKARQRSTGFGLGLPIAHSLTKVLGGTISLTSEPGVGTTVLLELP